MLGQRGQLPSVRDRPAVVDHRRVQLLRDGQRRPQAPAAAEAPADAADPRRAPLAEPGVGRPQVLPGRLVVDRAYERPGAVGRLGDRVVVEVDGEGPVSAGRQPPGHRPDMLVESPPLVDDDQAGQGVRRLRGRRQVAGQILGAHGAVGDLARLHRVGGRRGGRGAGDRPVADVLPGRGLETVVRLRGGVAAAADGDREDERRCERDGATVVDSAGGWGHDRLRADGGRQVRTARCQANGCRPAGNASGFPRPCPHPTSHRLELGFTSKGVPECRAGDRRQVRATTCHGSTHGASKRLRFRREPSPPR